MISYMKSVVSDPERKPMYLLIKESVHCLILERELPYYYFTSLLYKKNADNYRHYIGFRKIHKIINNYFYAKTNGRNYNLEDKLLFDEHLKKDKIKTTKLLAHSHNYDFYLDEKIIKVNNESDLDSFLTKLVSTSSTGSIFIKPVDGVGGKNVFKFDADTLRQPKKTSKLFKMMGEKRFLFQETVQQHQVINSIYPNSLNAMRVHSFYNRETDSVKIVSAIMRFGCGGTIVDNGSAGGLFVSVDINNWKMIGVGRSYLSTGGKTFEIHPDTNVRFDEKKIPHGNKIEKLICSAAKLFSSDFIGWDVAITSNGPIIIEGNDCPHLIMAQMACGGFKNHPVYKDIFKEYI